MTDAPLYYTSHVFCCTNRRPDGHPKGCCASKDSEHLRNYMKNRAKELGLSGAVAVAGSEPSPKAGERTPGSGSGAGSEQSRPNIRINGAGCLDRCEYGPAIVIYPEGVWYSPKNEADIDEILIVHLQQGGRVERLLMPAPPKT